jgi:hypothetical protein
MMTERSRNTNALAIRFRLDEWGAHLESYGEGAASEGAEERRQFVFDKPFLLYMQETSGNAPYLAIWIETAEVLERLDD